ncbi:MAG: chalcone isomerase family protein [Polyangiaceae bacterium]
MKFGRNLKSAAKVLSLFSVLAFASPASAIEPGKDGFYHTGSGVRTKSVAFVSVKVYAIRHDMKCLPSAKAKQAIIDADCDKRFSWRMLRDVDSEKIQNALREAFKNNNYGDAGKIDAFLSGFKGELKEGNGVSISYSADKKATTLWVQGGGSTTVAGADFMKAVWSIWFGNMDQRSLTDALMSNL